MPNLLKECETHMCQHITLYVLYRSMLVLYVKAKDKMALKQFGPLHC